MLKKIAVAFSSCLVFVAIAAISGYGQSMPVRGVVKVLQADGSSVPVEGVVVEPIRVDVERGKLPTTKTNRRGEFNFVGFQVGHTFVLNISGDKIAPLIYQNVRAGMEGLEVVVAPGNGKRYTEEEVRANIKSMATGTGGGTGLTAEQQKELAELQKQNEELIEKNKRIQQADAIALKSNEAGAAALKARNYDLAIQKYSEGAEAVPNYVGSTPILLNGKLLAHRQRGFEAYREGVSMSDMAMRDAKFQIARADYHAALATFDQAWAVINDADAAPDATARQKRDLVALELLTNVIEVHRIMAGGGVDRSKSEDAAKIFEDYFKLETDAAKKTTAWITLGDIHRYALEFDKAIPAYRKALEAQPDNTAVMASLGLSLFGEAASVDPPDRAKYQEGLNYLQRYVDLAKILPTDPPDVVEFKTSIIQTVQFLTEEEKLKAQPVPRATPARRRN
jgi:tetratricopeptide (TPR) repeat protein